MKAVFFFFLNTEQPFHLLEQVRLQVGDAYFVYAAQPERPTDTRHIKEDRAAYFAQAKGEREAARSVGVWSWSESGWPVIQGFLPVRVCIRCGPLLAGIRANCKDKTYQGISDL